MSLKKFQNFIIQKLWIFISIFVLKSLESANVPEPTVTQIPIRSQKLPLDTICGDLEGPEFKRLKSILGRDSRTTLTQWPDWSWPPALEWRKMRDGAWIPDLRIIKRVGKQGGLENRLPRKLWLLDLKRLRNPDFDFSLENLIFTQIHQNHQSSLISQNCHLTELFFNRSRRHTDDQKSEMIINFVKYMFRFHKNSKNIFDSKFSIWSKNTILLTKTHF